MNCPGHMLLFGSRSALVPRSAASLRGVVDAAPRRARRRPARPAACAPHHAGRRPHLLHAPTRSRTRSSRCLDFASYLYDLFGLEARFELSTRPDDKVGTDEEWDFTEGALKSALERRGIEYAAQRGRRRLLRPEDRPAHDRRPRPLVADGDDPARRDHAAALRPHLHGARQPGAHAVRHPPCAARLARALHRHPHRALRRRVPVLARAGAGAGAAGRRGAHRGAHGDRRAARERRATGSTSASRPRRSASGSARPSSRRSPSPSSSATARARRAWPIRERGGDQTEESLADFLAKLATLAS